MVGKLKQRADYTYKHNTKLGRHGWLRLTPAYSVKIVNEVFEKYKDYSNLDVLEPFLGTGTTPLCAGYNGYESTGLDINPFLTWFSNVKCSTYSEQVIENTYELMEKIIDDIINDSIAPCSPPPIKNIERWWSSLELNFLCMLKAGIEKINEDNLSEKNLLLVAFCRTLINCSNASFNHVSMSFKDKPEQLSLLDFEEIDRKNELYEQFRKNVDFVLSSASNNPIIKPKILNKDSRNIGEIGENKFDLVITSPPYPNRMSYIRELRPYMYWLGYLNEAREAGELDWEAIGGTWGIATSRLKEWIPDIQTYYPKYFNEIATNISNGDNKSGILMANYVARYFEDMWNHLKGIKSVLNEGAEIHYVVGNSTFYNVLVPVEEIYKDMLLTLGFKDVQTKVIRKRNSKKELFEFDVMAKNKTH